MSATTATARNGSSRLGKAAEVVPIRSMDIRHFEIPIRGVSPLIVQRFSEKSRKQIEDKQQQNARGGRGKRDPNAEFLAALYMMPGSGPPLSKTARYGVKASGFKMAMAKAAGRYVHGITRAFALGAFHVEADAGDLIQLKCSHPTMREDTVRLADKNRTLDLRYRPEFAEWSCILRISYNASVISAEQIVNLCHHAGYHIAWGELRAEKGYSYGRWEIVVQ